MRGILAALRDAANPFSILTKGSLILRDLDLLTQAAEVTDVSTAVSVGFVDDDLWRAVEPGTPSPRKRLEVCATLNDTRHPVRRADGPDPALPHRLPRARSAPPSGRSPPPAPPPSPRSCCTCGPAPANGSCPGSPASTRAWSRATGAVRQGRLRPQGLPAADRPAGRRARRGVRHRPVHPARRPAHPAAATGPGGRAPCDRAGTALPALSAEWRTRRLERPCDLTRGRAAGARRRPVRRRDRRRTTASGAPGSALPWPQARPPRLASRETSPPIRLRRRYGPGTRRPGPERRHRRTARQAARHARDPGQPGRGIRRHTERRSITIGRGNRVSVARRATSTLQRAVKALWRAPPRRRASCPLRAAGGR